MLIIYFSVQIYVLMFKWSLTWPLQADSGLPFTCFHQSLTAFWYKTIFQPQCSFSLSQSWSQPFIQGAFVPLEENRIQKSISGYQICSLILRYHCFQATQEHNWEIDVYTCVRIHTFISTFTSVSLPLSVSPLLLPFLYVCLPAHLSILKPVSSHRHLQFQFNTFHISNSLFSNVKPHSNYLQYIYLFAQSQNVQKCFRILIHASAKREAYKLEFSICLAQSTFYLQPEVIQSKCYVYKL